jgi:hypothetical protein
MPAPSIGLIQGAAPGEVGFVRRNGHLSVAFPKVYSGGLKAAGMRPELLTKHAALLARVLRRYRTDLARINVVEYGTSGLDAAEIAESGGLLDLLDAAAELHQDFQRFGLFYVKNVRQVSDPSGPIQWSRTIQGSQALISDDGVFYFDTIHRSRRRDPFDLFHRLHASVVREVHLLLGDPVIVSEEVVLDDETFAEVCAAPETFLAPIRERMYRERGRRLIDLISQFLNASARSAAAEASGESALCMTKDFEFVWEHMVRSIFENDQGRAIARLSAGRWFDARTQLEAAGIRPRADVLRAVATASEDAFRYVCVLDAKDKEIVELTGRSGSESDHYKQLVYASLLSSEPAERFLNVLAFPFLTLDASGTEAVRLLGCHWWWEMPQSSVFELALNYVTVCEAFLYERAIDAEGVIEMLLSADAAVRGH